MTAIGKSTTVNRLNILRGEPYTARVVRTVRGRVHENLPIAISERHQVLILRYFQNVRNFRDEESKLKSIMQGTGYNRSLTAFNLCMDFAKNGSTSLVLN